jgi:hypothetical protein
MGETETVTVAEVSSGAGSVGEPGTAVDLPVVELLTGRGFVTGKSGSGKSNTASVVIEKLLDRGFPVLVVDIDGEYYGLKEKYELLHVGGDEECDIQVSAEHAEKIAEMALGNNVPIVLDVSSFLDESEAADLLTEIARHLFTKEKKLKKPFLLVVEEVHEWIPEGGGLGECGRMLIKIGKRGRKHGLGIMGISQRPADVKKDFITQCDWLCWHRLTWRNDTKVVKRVLGGEYADAVEDLDDGEAFLVTDWFGETRRVQFHRKQTFDAGATPGLDDFERPDLKSVSDDLVGELESITEDQRQRQDRIEELERKLRERDRRIETLERDLEEARDLSRMADQFAEALFDHPGRSRMQLRDDGRAPDGPDAEQATLEETAEFDAEPAGEWPDVPTDDPPAAGTRGPDGNGPPDRSGDANAGASADAGGNGRSSHRPSGGRIVSSAPPDADGGSDRERDAPIDGAPEPWPDAGDDAAERPIVRRIREVLSELDPQSRRMLAHYRDQGPCSPVDAHVAAGGEGDRTVAYSHNSELREAGLISHGGRGRYDYALPDLVEAAHDGRLSDEEAARIVAAIECALDE